MFRHISKKLVVLLSDIASLWYKGEKMQLVLNERTISPYFTDISL